MHDWGGCERPRLVEGGAGLPSCYRRWDHSGAHINVCGMSHACRHQKSKSRCAHRRLCAEVAVSDDDQLWWWHVFGHLRYWPHVINYLIKLYHVRIWPFICRYHNLPCHSGHGLHAPRRKKTSPNSQEALHCVTLFEVWLPTSTTYARNGDRKRSVNLERNTRSSSAWPSRHFKVDALRNFDWSVVCDFPFSEFFNPTVFLCFLISR